jgi:hypothetical protein
MSEKIDAMSDGDAARLLAKAVLEGSVGHTFAGKLGAVRFCRRCQDEPCATEGEEVRHAAGCPVPVAEAVLAGKSDFEVNEHEEFVEIRIRRDRRDLPGIVRRALAMAASTWSPGDQEEPMALRELAEAMRYDAEEYEP